VIDRKFPGIGRVRKASGTSDASTHKAILAMFTMLVKKGRLDLVRAWADGLIHAMDLYDRYRTEKLDQLPSAETMRPLWSVADEWLTTIPAKQLHRARSVRHSWLALKRLPQPAQASIAHLPALLTTYRAQCEAKETAQMFVNARNNARAFLRDTVGTMHPLYLAVARVEPLTTNRAAHHPFTRTSLPVFLAAMREQHGPAIEAMARTLALTGMRPEEYWHDWSVEDGVLRVRTAKQRRGKVKYRRVFLVTDPVRPTVARRTFEDKMRQVTRHHICYDLRRTFMHLMEEARITPSRRRYYLGHSAGDVSELYEEHEVDDYLAADRRKLSRYLKGTTPRKAHDDE
jgi:hypothetical protein